MLAWMRAEPYLAALLTEIEAAPVDVDEWKPEGLQRARVNFPDDETHRAKVCLKLFDERDVMTVRRSIGGGDSRNEMHEAFVEMIVNPLVHFLEDRIEDGSAILGILERYKRRTEWFHQADLHAGTTPTLHGARRRSTRTCASTSSTRGSPSRSPSPVRPPAKRTWCPEGRIR